MCEPGGSGAEAEAEALRRFLEGHPALRVLAPGTKVRCALTGHELPCRLPDLQAYTAGKKYRRLSRSAPEGLDYGAYRPHLVPSTKNPRQLFCKLTLRHINRIPEHVLRHVQGRRYQRALSRYAACQREGVEYVPPCLQQKRRRRRQEEALSEGVRPPRRKGGFWEPPASDDGGSETEDSMSDLYPPELFAEKSPPDKESDHDFTSDSDEEAAKPTAQNGSWCENGSEEAMDVDLQTGTKRGKKQSGGLKKRFKSQNKKSKRFGKAVSRK